MSVVDVPCYAKLKVSDVRHIFCEVDRPLSSKRCDKGVLYVINNTEEFCASTAEDHEAIRGYLYSEYINPMIDAVLSMSIDELLSHSVPPKAFCDNVDFYNFFFYCCRFDTDEVSYDVFVYGFVDKERCRIDFPPIRSLIG